MSLVLLFLFSAFFAAAEAQDTPGNGSTGDKEQQTQWPLPPYGSQAGTPGYQTQLQPPPFWSPSPQLSPGGLPFAPAPSNQQRQMSVREKSAAAWSVLSRGRALVLSRQFGAALPFIRQFILLKPLEPEGYFWQGLALDELNETRQALASYNQAIEQVLKAGMDSAELRLDAGNALLKLGRLDEAIVNLRRAIEVDPKLAVAYLNLGRALIEKGDPLSALECLNHCQDLHLTIEQVSYYRAKAYQKLGKRDESAAEVRGLLEKMSEGAAREGVKREFASELAGN